MELGFDRAVDVCRVVVLGHPTQTLHPKVTSNQSLCKEAHLPMEGTILSLIVLVILALYFIPTIVAVKRDHPSKGGIIVLNIFLGWTFIGWVVSLAWSFTSTGRR